MSEKPVIKKDGLIYTPKGIQHDMEILGYNKCIKDTNIWLKSLCENELSEEKLFEVAGENSTVDNELDGHYVIETCEVLAKHIKEVLKV